ncbi:MAG: hypothetical protein GF313_16385, partial [Caldithrix sp.]|nr:hypothetical protein [Caldithrix sp.]
MLWLIRGSEQRKHYSMLFFSRKRSFGTSVYAQVWSEFISRKSGLLGLLVIIILFLLALFPDWFTAYDPVEQGNLLTDRFIPPGKDHFFGTDKFGRDIFSRVIHGSRTSLLIAVSVVLLSSTIGLLYG